MYARYTGENKTISGLEKELERSLDNAYELYLSLLSLLLEMGRLAGRNYETAVARSERLGIERPSDRLVANRFMKQLEDNRELKAFREHPVIDWTDEEELVRSFLNEGLALDVVDDYLKDSAPSTYAQERELWRNIYKGVIVGNETLDELLEEKSLYWNDDKDIIDTFVLKTVNRFTEDTTPDMPLLPKYRDESDWQFANELLRNCVAHEKELLDLIESSTRGWRMERIALMDRVILLVALCEIQYFSSIPLTVSINEYVEIAKWYSTPKSGSYVNGIIDAVAKKLKKENRLTKA
jgi:N utilization substance protein B